MTRRVLVVCTANVCRSPMAEAFLRRGVAQGHLDVLVSSAGVRMPNLPVDPDAVECVQAWGLDITRHTPRQVTRELLRSDGADLVITMTREHVRDVVAFDRAVWPRTFSLVELVRRARRVREDQHSGDWDSWLALLGEGRSSRDLMAPDRSDDIEDPYGTTMAAHTRAADTIRVLVAELFSLAPFPAAATWPAPEGPPRR